MAATLESVHAEAVTLKSTLAAIAAELHRSYGNIAAGKVNRAGSGLTTIVDGLQELIDAEADPEAVAGGGDDDDEEDEPQAASRASVSSAAKRTLGTARKAAPPKRRR